MNDSLNFRGWRPRHQVDNKWLNQVVFKDSNTMLNIEPAPKVNTGDSILTLEDGVQGIN